MLRFALCKLTSGDEVQINMDKIVAIRIGTGVAKVYMDAGIVFEIDDASEDNLSRELDDFNDGDGAYEGGILRALEIIADK